MLPLESVPNFSEGRDQATIDAIGGGARGQARLLDVHADPDHNRSVFTLVGAEAELVEALVAGVEVARERIDLRAPRGAHPRIGAADVVPLVPIVPERPGARRAGPRAARGAARRARTAGVHLRPARARAGVLPARRQRASSRGVWSTGSSCPTSGRPSSIRRRARVIVGARAPLIAFNVNLRAPLEVAREIAAVVRESGGGFPGVRALGLDLPRAGLVQVSMNVEDWEAAPLARGGRADHDRGRAARGRGASAPSSSG